MVLDAAPAAKPAPAKPVSLLKEIAYGRKLADAECRIRLVPAKNDPLLEVAAVDVMPLLHFMTNVVDAVALTALDGSIVPKLSVAGAVVTLQTPKIFALTVSGDVPPAATPVDTSNAAIRPPVRIPLKPLHRRTALILSYVLIAEYRRPLPPRAPL